MLAILRLGDNAYGVTIGGEITECTRREPAPGALYTTLDRLEDKGLVASRLGDPTPQRGGRAKRYFVLNAKGLAAITRAQQSYRRFWKVANSRDLLMHNTNIFLWSPLVIGRPLRSEISRKRRIAARSGSGPPSYEPRRR